MTDRQERMTMPGQEPTDEDLRHDVEQTRQELAETVAALGEKADVKTRVQHAAHEKAEALRERGDELAAKLPDAVAPVVTGVTRKPMIPLAGLLAIIVALRFWLKRRSR